MRELTAFELETLAWIDSRRGYTSEDNGPWQRSWTFPDTPSRARALSNLAVRGLIEQKSGRGKLPSRYRSLKPIDPDVLADLESDE